MTSFIDQALIFIASSVILVPLFQRLGFGSVLGYLMAGVIVGPHCLKFIGESEHIVHFAELGVVLLLFIIGLEIEPRKLWSMRQKLFSLGLVQVVVCTLVFALIAKLMGMETLPAVIVAFGLSLSSTAFALQNLHEKNQFSTEFGQSSFSVLLMQDLLAIPALAIIPSLAVSTGTDGGSNLTKVGLFAAIVIGLFLFSRFTMRPLFRLLAHLHNREIFTAATLLIVFGVATLMIKIDLSAALGTFIAGVLLADSEYRHELEANLDPFKGLLMGLFFIGVGMEVSLQLIMQKPFLMLSLALGYLVLKMTLIYGIGRINRMKHENAKLMALNIGQGGEFAFVIFGIALSFKLVEQEILIMLTAVITLSMVLNPLFLLANERLTQRCRPLDVPKEFDSIPDTSPQVIIGGFGRFGQIFGRVLRSQGIPFVAMDHDGEQIELVRRFGNKVYYGDITRHDLLEAAGAGKAKYFVLAIDDRELSLKAARTLREHYPHLKIFARARNRGHAFDLMDLGVTFIKRETFDSSAHFVGDLLHDMGMKKEQVKVLVEKFTSHDEIMLMNQYKARDDEKEFVSISQQGTAQLEEVLRSENSQSFIS